MWTFLQRFRSSLPSRGFTLTELVVVIAIMTLLTSVFILQQQRFESSTLLRSLAYSIALSIREAQTYGISVKSFGGNFPAYGVYFEPATYPKDYFLFADVNDNGKYDPGTEYVEKYTLLGSHTITDICGTLSGNPTPQCYSTNFIDWVAITFRRPELDACIATGEGANEDVCGTDNTSQYSQAYIQISGPGGVTRSVVVTPSGQISVGSVGS